MFGKIIYVQESSQHGMSKQARGKHSASLSQNAPRHYRTDKILIFDSLLKQKNRTALDSNFYALQKEYYLCFYGSPDVYVALKISTCALGNV